MHWYIQSFTCFEFHAPVPPLRGAASNASVSLCLCGVFFRETLDRDGAAA